MPPINEPTPPGYVRSQSGKLFPVSSGFGAPKRRERRFLVALQFHEGDRLAAEDLAQLIGELEPTKNKQADLLLFRRGDCRPMPKPLVDRLKLKFETVHEMACARGDARGYPHGPNQMFGALITMMAHQMPFKEAYFAFVNLEPDCVPTRQGWISELIEAFHAAKQLGYGVTGFIHDNPVTHLNGLAVWEREFLLRVPQLIGSSPTVAYDIWHSKRILPHATTTDKIAFRYRCPTITPEELFGSEETPNPACLFHGVKDDTARKAVRARCVQFKGLPIKKAILTSPVSPNGLKTEPPAEGWTTLPHIGPPSDPVPLPAASETATSSPLTLPNVPNSITMGGAMPDLMALSRGPAIGGPSVLSQPTKTNRPNVYTYAHKHKGINPHEMKAVLEAWKKGWQAQGWNPVVLTVRDAAKHPKFDELSAKVEKLPCSGDKFRQLHRFLRWMSLERAGGGLLTDWDVLPNGVHPDDLTVGDGQMYYLTEKDGPVVAAHFEAQKCTAFLDHLLRYEPDAQDLAAEKPNVADQSAMSSFQNPTPCSVGAVHHFSGPSLGNKRKSVAMEEYLSNPATLTPA